MGGGVWGVARGGGVHHTGFLELQRPDGEHVEVSGHQARGAQTLGEIHYRLHRLHKTQTHQGGHLKDFQNVPSLRIPI